MVVCLILPSTTNQQMAIQTIPLFFFFLKAFLFGCFINRLLCNSVVWSARFVLCVLGNMVRWNKMWEETGQKEESERKQYHKLEQQQQQYKKIRHESWDLTRCCNKKNVTLVEMGAICPPWPTGSTLPALSWVCSFFTTRRLFIGESRSFKKTATRAVAWFFFLFFPSQRSQVGQPAAWCRWLCQNSRLWSV